MIQKFIKHDLNTELLLIFAGWGMDEHTFSFPIANGYDCMVCYDYRTLDFDSSLLDSYHSIRLLAWSMGVWVATQVLTDLVLPWNFKLALNGTPYPIDDERGIPKAVFYGTLDNLSELTLGKFYRRMCGSASEMQKFMAGRPERDYSDIHDELVILEREVISHGEKAIHFWDKAIIGMRDLIFPFKNQQKAWNGVYVEYQDIAHYDHSLLMYLLGKEDLWIRN